MAGVESMNQFGLAGLFALQLVGAVYGSLLAIGRLRLTSGFTLEALGSRRSRITGLLLVIGQLLGFLAALNVGQPSLMLVLAPVAAALVLGWVIDRLVPNGGAASAEKI
jgi:hypothetical protein